MIRRAGAAVRARMLDAVRSAPLSLVLSAPRRRHSAGSAAVSADRTATPAATGPAGGAPRPRNGALEAAEHARCLSAVAGERDRAAFEVLFRAFAPRVKGYLARLGGDSASAEELMQETMVQVWRKAGLFDPAKASAATWIFTIARNLRIDAFRRDRRPDFDVNDPTLVPDAEPPPDGTLIRNEEAGRLAAALVDLSPAEQAVLRLAYFDGLSQEAIAARLAIPLGTVKSRVRLAFGKLRAALSSNDPQP